MVTVVGDGQYFLNVGLTNGQLYVSLYMGAEKDSNQRNVGGERRFDDNAWHSVTITRQVTEVKYDGLCCG